MKEKDDIRIEDFSPETLNEMEMDSLFGGTNAEVMATYNCLGGNCAAGCGADSPKEEDGPCSC